MALFFDRPVGAAADLSELEYVSALLQTNEDSLRADGSLTAKDIHFYLRSRHAIDCPVEDVEKYIVEELAGTPLEAAVERESENAENNRFNARKDLKIDLVQLTSLLLIPVLRENATTSCPAGESAKVPEHSRSIEKSIKVDGTDFFDCENICDESDEDAFSCEPSNHDPSAEIQENVEHEKDEHREANENESALKRRNIHRFGIVEASKSNESDQKYQDRPMDAERSADLIDLVLSIILQETKLEYGTNLNGGVLQEILITFREDWSDEILHGMIEACGDNPKLDRETFLKALTHDTETYDLSRHQKVSTHYEDARQALSNSRGHGRLQRFWAASNIDVTADTYISLAWTILAYICFFTFPLSFLDTGITVWATELQNVLCSDVTGFFCTTLSVFLFVFINGAILGTAATLFLFFTTLGNSVYVYGSRRGITMSSERMLGSVTHRVLLLCIGIAFTASTFYFCFVFFRLNDHSIENLIGGLIFFPLLLVTQIVQVIRVAIPSRYYENYVDGSIMVSGAIRAEFQQKQACIFKVNKLVMNAVSCYSSSVVGDEVFGNRDSASMYDLAKSLVDSLDFYRSAVSDALLRFAMTEDVREKTGGVPWTIKKTLDGKIRREEGVWLSPKHIIANFFQWLLPITFIYLTVILLSLINESDDDWLQKNHLYYGVIFGGIIAIISSANIAFTCIASGYSTVLKYRSGYYPSLHESRWLGLRQNLHTVNILIFAALAASLFSGLVNGALALVVTLVLISQDPAVRSFVDPILATLLGATVVFLIKLAAFQCARINWYGAFMRRRPALANLYNTIQDAWNIGLATFTIFIRLGKLVGVFLLSIGRIDAPLLDANITSQSPLGEGIFAAFEKSLLLNEAHRHPYIERLGYIYLLKIGCRETFGTQAGAAWRILFTLALCPWLGKYRLNEFHRKVSRMHNADAVRQLESRVVEMEKKLETARKELQVHLARKRESFKG